jgi:predicted dehydrogenase
MNPVGVALVGAGPWGGTLARAFSRVEGARLRWICDVDPERRARAAAENPDARASGSVDEVLADAEVRAAVIAVDSPNHYAVGLRVLAAGRHLLVEKPMALSVADAVALRDAAAAGRRVLTVGHLLLHHPAVVRARELIGAGAIGDLLTFESVRTAGASVRRSGSAWWTLAPHDISLALHVFDALPAEVSVVAGARGPEHQDLSARATLRFADGRVGHVHVTRITDSPERRSRIGGTRRSIVFDELSREHPLRFVPNAGEGEGEAAGAENIAIDEGDALFAQCRHFIACVARQDPSGGNGAHALAVVQVLVAGARSMQAGGEPVTVA